MIVAKTFRVNPRDTKMVSHNLNELELEMNADVILVVNLGPYSEGSLISELLVILRVKEESARDV